jgi:hypothetical protein
MNCREPGEERIKNLPLRVEEKKRILRVPQGEDLRRESFMKRLIGLLFLVLTVPVLAWAGTDRKDDPSKWTPIKLPGKQKAPEFAGITEWLNSPPLTMAKLKGKVVVVHFMTFG